MVIVLTELHCVFLLGSCVRRRMSSSALSKSAQPRGDGPPAWFLEKFPEIDWDQVRFLRRHELGTVPTALMPKPSTVDPRWPCMICPATFETAQEIHVHVRSVHEAIHNFFLQTPVFFTRCVVCCEYR